jgi:hypothetical protein
MVSGHVYPQADEHDWGTSFAEKPLLFHNLDGRKFVQVEAVRGSGLAAVLTARGAAFGDLFNDGHTDVVINNQDGPPTLLKNVLRNGHHWIEFKLIGGAKVPRDAIGAKVFLRTGTLTQRRDVLSGGSFASSGDPRVLFGLGDAAAVDEIEIFWPEGDKQKIVVTAVDAIYTVEQHKGIVDTYRPAAAIAGKVR